MASARGPYALCVAAAVVAYGHETWYSSLVLTVGPSATYYYTVEPQELPQVLPLLQHRDFEDCAIFRDGFSLFC